MFQVNTDEVLFHIELGTQLDEQLDLGFDLGLPGLGLDLNGGVKVEIGFDASLEFGLNKTEGFFLVAGDPNDPNDLPEFDFHFSATIPGFDAAGTLAFLKVEAEDDLDAPTFVGGSFSVDIKDPSGDGLLTQAEIAGGDFSQIVETKFDVSADVNLKLLASFGDDANFPSLQADLNVDWDFGGNAIPHVAFNNVRLDVGEFFTKFVGPILDGVDDFLEFLEPLNDLMDLLREPLPAISELAGTNITLLDLGKYYAKKYNVNEYIQFVTGFLEVMDRLQTLRTAITSEGGEIYIDFGSFDLGGADRAGTSRKSSPTSRTRKTP